MTFEMDAQSQKSGGSGSEKPAVDRKLGDEWEDWDGTQEGEIDEPKGRFILLATLVCLVIVGLLLAGAYLVQPRVSEWSPSLQWTAKVLFFGLLGAGICCYGLLLLELLTSRVSLLPYRWSQGMVLWLLPKAVWAGGKFGLSRDRVANSFIKVNNALTRSRRKRIQHRKLLILLPRCLGKTTRQEIRKLTDGQPYAVSTVGGGEEARNVIRKERPTCIIALACERDLVSGIRDVALHVPVIGIANKRPEGPCRNTHIDMEEFQQALQFFESAHGRRGPEAHPYS